MYSIYNRTIQAGLFSQLPSPYLKTNTSSFAKILYSAKSLRKRKGFNDS